MLYTDIDGRKTCVIFKVSINPTLELTCLSTKCAYIWKCGKNVRENIKGSEWGPYTLEKHYKKIPDTLRRKL